MSKRTRNILIAVLIIVLVAYLGVSWYFSSQIVAFTGETLAEARARVGDPAQFGLPEPEDFTLDVNGVTLSGWLFRQDAPANCGVVMLHGITTTRYGMLDYAPIFWERGCDLLLYDHRHHGDSTGDYGTYGYYEKADASAVIDWFAEQTGLAPGQIGIMGESYGAATALQTAEQRPDLAFVAADSSYRNLITIVDEQAHELYGPAIVLAEPGALAVAGLRARFWPPAVSPENAAANITIPIFLAHSLQDEFTAAAHSQDIFDRIPHERKALHLTDWGAPHTQSVTTDYAAYKQYIDDFLATYVPGFGTP